MNYFLNGAIMMAFTVTAVFFLRFWRRSGDRLFLLFSIAFGILAANRIVMAVQTQHLANPGEHQTHVYVIRLAAFMLILIAIIDKNRFRAAPEPHRTAGREHRAQ